jgi:hypothetical protein
MLSWNTFNAQMNHGQTKTHKTHHGPDLGGATTFSLIVYSVPNHRTNTQMSFCPETPKFGVLKFPKLGLLQLWRPITSCADLWLGWGLKQSCSPCQELSKDMQHVVYTRVNRGDSWLLVIKNQIGNLTLDPSFSHNLWFKYPNVSCKPILDIDVPRSFQWYKEFFNPMRFDPYDLPLKIRKSIKSPIPKVGGSSLGSVGVHSLTLSYTPKSMKCDSQASFLAHTFASPCVGCEPKARARSHFHPLDCFCKPTHM